MPEPVRVALRGVGDDERAVAGALLADRRIVAAEVDPEVVWVGCIGDALRAVEEGRSVLLSGPPSGELDALDAAARAAGVVVAVRHRRASPPFAEAAALVAEGRAGLPRAIHVHLIEAGGASIERLVFEAVDAVRWIVGLDPLSARTTEAPVDGPGAAIAIVELERDVPLTVVAGRSPGSDPASSGLRRIVLVGSQGMLALEEDRPKLEVHGGASRPGDGGATAAIAAALAAELVGIVREGRPPTCSLTDARAALL